MVASAAEADDRDVFHSRLGGTGAAACFESAEVQKHPKALPVDEQRKGYNIWLWRAGGNATTLTYSSEAGRHSRSCDISADGRAVAFHSDSSLVAGVETPRGVLRVFVTNDDGASFMQVSPSHTESANSYAPVLSSDGSFVAFLSNMEHQYQEPWLARLVPGESRHDVAKVADFSGKLCDKAAVFKELQRRHGAQNLTDNGITESSITSSSCTMAALWDGFNMPGGAGLGGIVDRELRLSDDGRFLVYTSAISSADAFGTHEVRSPVLEYNAFLYDRILGMTWQVTKAGPAGSGLQTVEEACCTSVPVFRQRGTCRLRDEMLGKCCWQYPCRTPALYLDISGDGKVVAFASDVNYLEPRGSVVDNDYEVWLYHVPTSALYRLTNTSDADLDDFNPALNAKGDRVVFDGANQVFMASMTYGCSRHPQASNFAANPDVEECAASGAAWSPAPRRPPTSSSRSPATPGRCGPASS